jgi:hypothetical protein
MPSATSAERRSDSADGELQLDAVGALQQREQPPQILVQECRPPFPVLAMMLSSAPRFPESPDDGVNGDGRSG